MVGYKNSHNIHIVGIGIDSASFDNGNTTTFVTHRVLAKENIYGIENMKDLHVSTAISQLTKLVVKWKNWTVDFAVELDFIMKWTNKHNYGLLKIMV